MKCYLTDTLELLRCKALTETMRCFFFFNSNSSVGVPSEQTSVNGIDNEGVQKTVIILPLGIILHSFSSQIAVTVSIDYLGDNICISTYYAIYQ